MNMEWVEPITLKGKFISLIPLDPSHEEGLIEAINDGNISNVWYARVPSAEKMGKEIKNRLEQQSIGAMLPFTVVDSTTREVLGMTCYQTIDEPNKRVEIGFTWYRKSCQRSPTNTEAKLLLLSHAFEQLGTIAVGFKTNYFNTESRRAIERLGAKLDGILRNHMILQGGILRDTCYYSIIQSEWPTVKTHLRWLLETKYDKHE